MTIKASGSLALSEIQAEFGGSNPIGLAEYYRNLLVSPNNTGIPTSGQISIGQFYNAVKYYPAGTHGYTVLSTAGAFSWTAPANTTEIRIVVIGGGGAGSQGGYDNGDNGIAARPGEYQEATVAFYAGQVISGTIGQGGQNNLTGISGGATTATVNGTTYTGAGGWMNPGSNSPGGGGGAWYLDVNHYASADSTLANSYYTTLFGTRTGGYSLAGSAQIPQYDEFGGIIGYTSMNALGTNGIYGGGGGGGGGPNGGFGGNYAGGKGGDGVVIIWY